MGLKPLRVETERSTIQYFLNETAERGLVVIYDTSSSGLGDMDDAGHLVKKPTDSGGVPVGVLMNDVVDLDLTRQRLNWHKDEVNKNSKVDILMGGMVRTNMLTGANPIPGSGAYFTTNGYITMTAGGTNSQIGRFHSAKDADGYADVYVNLPR
jgi:hypothetical protein